MPIRIVVAGVLTAALLGAVAVSELFGSDSGSAGAPATTVSTAAPTTSAGSGTTTSSPAPTVRLNPAWPSKGTSRYSEAESAGPSTTAPR